MLTARAASAPRIRFETVTREARDVLPRMDVAVFVGFAAAGPLHVPVVVEDAKQYTAIFGADPVLAWDPETGAPTHAHLGPAVRAFFANGGRATPSSPAGSCRRTSKVSPTTSRKTAGCFPGAPWHEVTPFLLQSQSGSMNR